MREREREGEVPGVVSFKLYQTPTSTNFPTVHYHWTCTGPHTAPHTHTHTHTHTHPCVNMKWAATLAVAAGKLTRGGRVWLSNWWKKGLNNKFLRRFEEEQDLFPLIAPLPFPFPFPSLPITTANTDQLLVYYSHGLSRLSSGWVPVSLRLGVGELRMDVPALLRAWLLQR